MGSIGDFGDINALNASGIELAMLCLGGPGFPHGTNMPAIALAVREDGLSPDWFVRATAKLLKEAYTLKVLGICDQSGGLNLGAFLICCAAAEKLGGSFTANQTLLKSLLPDMAIPPALVNQGVRLYP